MSCDDDATGYKATAVLFKTCIEQLVFKVAQQYVVLVFQLRQCSMAGGLIRNIWLAPLMRCIHKPQAPRLVVRDIRENDQTINPASRRPVVLHSATDGILRAARHVKGPREEKTLLRLQSSILANHCIENSAKRQLTRDQLVEGLGTLRC